MPITRRDSMLGRNGPNMNERDLDSDGLLPELLPSPTIKSAVRFPLHRTPPLMLHESKRDTGPPRHTASRSLSTPEPSSDTTSHWFQSQTSEPARASSIDRPCTPPHRLIQSSIVELNPSPAPRNKPRRQYMTFDLEQAESDRKRRPNTQREDVLVWRERIEHRRRENELSFSTAKLDLEIRELDRQAELCQSKVADLCRRYMTDEDE